MQVSGFILSPAKHFHTAFSHIFLNPLTEMILKAAEAFL
jgi:hypothetical protein